MKAKNVNGNHHNGRSGPQYTFHKFACKVADLTGSAWTFLIALFVIVGWAFLGPIFHYSDSWQLVINTGTTIITFLMVFLIQNTQNRDAKALHLKLDELIHAIKGARNKMMDLENMTDEELETIKKEFEKLSRHREQQRPQPQQRKDATVK
jgi:low affinity Fe/Cu permease